MKARKNNKPHITFNLYINFYGLKDGYILLIFQLGKNCIHKKTKN